MNKLFALFFGFCLFWSCTNPAPSQQQDVARDEQAINQSIQEWDKAWEIKDLEMALKHYADTTDWTNAFGDRVQTKADLKKLLSFIFNMDFVMAGENNYGTNEITFLTDQLATVRSQNIRTNQKWPDGSPMDDRYINHLRVYEKMEGKWLIVNHMISQAWPKRGK